MVTFYTLLRPQYIRTKFHLKLQRVSRAQVTNGMEIYRFIFCSDTLHPKARGCILLNEYKLLWHLTRSSVGCFRQTQRSLRSFHITMKDRIINPRALIILPHMRWFCQRPLDWWTWELKPQRAALQIISLVPLLRICRNTLEEYHNIKLRTGMTWMERSRSL